MFTGYQVIVLVMQFIGTLVAVWGVVSKAQSSMKDELQHAIDEVKLAHAKSIEEARSQSSRVNENLHTIGLQINTLLEGDVRELQARVARLESGQDEWTKTLRQRTHDLANDVQALRLTVELMKVQPHKAGAS